MWSVLAGVSAQIWNPWLLPSTKHFVPVSRMIDLSASALLVSSGKTAQRGILRAGCECASGSRGTETHGSENVGGPLVKPGGSCKVDRGAWRGPVGGERKLSRGGGGDAYGLVCRFSSLSHSPVSREIGRASCRERGS